MPTPAQDDLRGRAAPLWLGARVGVLFAACDGVAASWLARAATHPFEYAQQSAVSFALSALLHAAIGALAALLVAPFARRRAPRLGRAPEELVARGATLGVVVAIGALQASLWSTRAVEIRQSAALALGWTVLIALSCAGPGLARRLAGAVSPWPVALTCALVPWLAQHALLESSWTAKQVAAAGVALAVVVAAAFARRLLASPRATSPVAAGVALLAALAGTRVPQELVVREPEPRPAPQSPSVILISLDTVRADHLSVYGYERDTTPFLRELARESAVFENAYSAGDFTLSSHASMFTGEYPRRHGARFDPDRSLPTPLVSDAVTLAELLSERGFATLAVASNCVLLAPQFGLAQGFDRYDARARAIAFPRTPRWTLRGWLHDRLREVLPPNEFDLVFRGAEEINARVLEELGRRDPARPFFLFVNYMEAHAPYRPPPPYDTLYGPAEDPMEMAAYRDQREQVFGGKEQVEAEELARYVALYDGEIRYLDEQLRALFARLRELGIYDEALIVVTSDHGEAFGEHGTLEHGMSVYQEQVRVPLIVKRPRAREGSAISAVASGVDLVPTVLAELGFEPPPDLPGRALFGAPDPDRVVYSEHYPTEWHTTHNPSRAVHQTAALGERFGVIRYDDGRLESFDLDQDPREERPLPQPPPALAQLVTDLERWIAPRRWNTPKGRARTLDALRMLGYGK